jgi:hypothetical protein
MEVFSFILASIGVAATALLVAASLRLASALSTILAAWVVASAEVVLLGEVLSLVRAVSPWGYLAGEALALAGAAAIWQARGRPGLAVRRVPVPALRRHPILLALGTVVAAAFGYQAFLVLATPPNNWDSLAYHLSRTAYWLQHGGIAYVPNAHTARENAFAPDSELAILYTFTFIRGDGAAAVPQLAAELALLLAVAGLALRVGFSRPAAAFAALLTATLPEVALQATTTQNDLTVAALVAVSAYFVLGRSGPELALAGVALALGVGTKPTVVLGLSTLFALAALSVPAGPALARAAAFAVVSFLLLGAYGYVQNIVETRRVFGDPAAVAGLQPDETLAGTASTAARLLYRFVDVSGLESAQAWTGPIERAGETAFDLLRIPVNPAEATGRTFSFRVNVRSDPDVSYFGPLGVLLVLPLTLAFSCVLLRRPERAVLALSIPLAVVAIALVYRYNEFVGRFLLTPVALVMPLSAWLYGRRILAAAVAAVGVVALGLAHAHDVAKPTGLGGTAPVWRLSREEAQGVTRIGMPEVLGVIERRIPERARVGVLLGEDDWDYPLYGPRLRRRLVPLPRYAALGEAERRGLHWVVVGATPGPGYLPGWEVRYFPASMWTLLHRP